MLLKASRLRLAMASTDPSSESLPSLHRAILLTVLYGDLFDHALTVDEIHRYLGVPCPERRDLEDALDALDGRYLYARDGVVTWRGRESTIELRHRRRRLAAGRWPVARRFARWLGWVPFLRMVAVCGSQAVENGDDDGDVDLFLIAAPNRLWLAQTTVMALRRLGRLLGAELCPNYLLSENALELEKRDLYTAREAAQAVPLWGAAAYAEFMKANRWIGGFLPQAAPDDRHPPPRPHHRLTAAFERVLGGRLGDLLDRAVYRAMLRYYTFRLRRHGWRRQDVERAYRRDRQRVITGGYAAAVADRFVERGLAAFDGALSRDELERWFFGAGHPGDLPEPAREQPDPLYAGLMAARYGGGG